MHLMRQIHIVWWHCPRIVAFKIVRPAWACLALEVLRSMSVSSSLSEMFMEEHDVTICGNTKYDRRQRQRHLLKLKLILQYPNVNRRAIS